jgi:hypothetical protein
LSGPILQSIDDLECPSIKQRRFFCAERPLLNLEE